VIVSGDDEWKPRSSETNSNPDAAIVAAVSRVVREPPSARVQKSASSQRCTRRNSRWRERTCSQRRIRTSLALFG